MCMYTYDYTWKLIVVQQLLEEAIDCNTEHLQQFWWLLLKMAIDCNTATAIKDTRTHRRAIASSAAVIRRGNCSQLLYYNSDDCCWRWQLIATQQLLEEAIDGTANPTWGDIFESSKLKARPSLLPKEVVSFAKRDLVSVVSVTRDLVSVTRDVGALRFELWNSIRNCHPKWDWLYYRASSAAVIGRDNCSQLLYYNSDDCCWRWQLIVIQHLRSITSSDDCCSRCNVPPMGWLWLVESKKLYVSFAKKTYKRDAILQKRPISLSILLTVATPYVCACLDLIDNFTNYGVATISRLLQTTGLFCKRAL